MCDAESLWLRREVSVRLRVALDGFGVAFGVGSAATRSQINYRYVRLKC